MYDTVQCKDLVMLRYRLAYIYNTDVVCSYFLRLVFYASKSLQLCRSDCYMQVTCRVTVMLIGVKNFGCHVLQTPYFFFYKSQGLCRSG